MTCWHNHVIATLSEFIRALKYDPKLYEKVKGDWYWVNDQPEFTIPGYYRINYERGSISIVSPFDLKNIPLDERAYVWRCDGMLMLLIKGDDASRRLELGGSDIFDGVPVAVAVINVSDMEKVMAKGREAIQRLKRGIRVKNDLKRRIPCLKPAFEAPCFLSPNE